MGLGEMGLGEMGLGEMGQNRLHCESAVPFGIVMVITVSSSSRLGNNVRFTLLQCVLQISYNACVRTRFPRSNSYISRVIANFVLKFPNFRYCGNRGRSLC